MTNTSLNIWKFRVRFREFPEKRILARYTKMFHSIRISPRNFQNDRLNGSLFENSTILDFPVHVSLTFDPIWKVPKILV